MSNWAIVFEDNEQSPVSKLLESCRYGGRLYFSEGNDLLSLKVEELIEEGYDEFIVFIDLVPDNKSTKNLYLTISSDLDELAMFNNVKISLIPIFCIEYVVLSYIKENNFGTYKDRKILDVYLQDIKKLYSDISGASLEKKYKSLLNGRLSNCLHNIKGQRSVIGMFYNCDCDCEKFHCYCKCQIGEKAERLYLSLPIVFSEEDYLQYLKKLRIQFEECSISSIKEDIRMLYKEVCLSLNLGEVKIL